MSVLIKVVLFDTEQVDPSGQTCGDHMTKLILMLAAFM